MASGTDKKRSRQDSDTKKSPTQIQTTKKYKHIENLEIGCFELDSEDIREISEVVNKQVSTKNMAEIDQEMLTQSIIKAFGDPTVIEKIIKPIKEEIRKGFQAEIDSYKAELQLRDETIKNYEKRLEELEMYGRRNGVRIHGIKETKGENTDKIVRTIAKKIGAKIPDVALGRSHRVGRSDSDRPRAIIAKFVGHNNKVELLKHKKNLKELMEKDEEIKEMAEDLDIGILVYRGQN